MTVPALANELIFNFQLKKVADPEDVAQFSIWTLNVGSDPTDQTHLDNLTVTAADIWVADIGDGDFCDNVVFTGCIGRTFSSDGKTLLESSKAPHDPWAGTADPPALPWETSLAVSLYTYQPGTFQIHGRRHRGRFYLPPMAASVLDNSNSGFVANSSISARLSGYKTFLNHLGGLADDSRWATVGVFSRMDSVVRPATFVSIDAKIDSQRRRQNRETAARASLAL